MYLPEHFAERDRDSLHDLIEANPLGTVVTLGGGGLAADPIPFVLDRAAGEHGTLLGHVARNNPLWRDHDPDVGALVLFTGPDAYISPTWYPSKQVTHEVVPTWNYLTVHAAGPLIVHDDVRWVRRQAGMLTNLMEGERAPRWKMGDAPQAYLETMLANIVGIEIPIRTLTGKWKVGQNRTPEDRAGAVAGLRAEGGAAELEIAAAMARVRPGE